MNELAPTTPPLLEETPRLPFAFARRHGVILSTPEGRTATVLCRAKIAPQVLVELRRFVQRPILIRPLSEQDFEAALQRRYEQTENASQAIVDDMGSGADLSEVAQALSEPTDLLEHGDDAPIIRLINALLSQAIRENASDIHIEPFEGRLAVRFRVDGALRHVLSPPRAVASLVVSRIKVMAKLDIAEKRLPQDGRISIRIANRPVDVRVSTLPCGQGERVVLRLLDKQAGRLDLEQLGMNACMCATIDKLIHYPHGIFLVTGPTGSGKTTTLYAALTRLNDASRNVMTIEDPIEYYLDGVAQSQVNPKVELSFARGLRAILRQDPDVVMVGEIRDLETAQIAVQASLTGHLVLSTLHTNSAVGAVTRLRDMGTEAYLLASSLLGVLAQRLVRVLCSRCKTPHAASAAERARLAIATDDPITLYSARGCPDCRMTGYRGRTGIYEIIALDDGLRAMIHEGAPQHDLDRYARRSSASIHESGRDKVLAGVTTPEEALRVTQDI